MKIPNRSLRFLAYLFSVALGLCTSNIVNGQTWARTYSGYADDYARSIQETADGGFILAGDTESFGAGDSDIWVLKLDALGEVEWQKTYGGPGTEEGNAVRQTPDGGYVVAGSTNSFGSGDYDAWVLKLDQAGNVVWEKVYQMPLGDEAFSIERTVDGGYILAGYTTFAPRAPEREFWILKLSSQGTIETYRIFGGIERDQARSVKPTSGGGYIVAGSTDSFGAGSRDMWILKLDDFLNVTWQKAYGGTESESFRSIWEVSTGDYIVAGSTHSFGPANSTLVVKLDSLGTVEWERVYGSLRVPETIQETPDGGFILASPSSLGPGGTAILLLKLDVAGNIEWEKTYGWLLEDSVESATQTGDGGFAVAGRSTSFNLDATGRDLWILRLNGSGDIEPACAFIADADSRTDDSSVLVQDTIAIERVMTIQVLDSRAVVQDTDAEIEEQCPDTSCERLICDGITVVPDPACEGEFQTFMLLYEGGEEPVTVEWDFDGDALVDAFGNPVNHAASPGEWTVTVWVMDSCADPGFQGCFLATTATVHEGAASLSEVSDLSGGEHPLIVEEKMPTTLDIRVDKERGATAYNVYVDELGSWYSPTEAEGSLCSITTWTDNGDGTVTLEIPVPPDDLWLAVTASNSCAESPSGPDSRGLERTTIGAWALCGAAP
jgi:hypothetical protein